MNRRDRNKAEKPAGVAPWMLTYGDMVTLILTFFVLLFSMSTLDKEKFDIFITSFQGSLSLLDGGKTLVDEPAVAPGVNDMKTAQMIAEEKEFRKILAGIKGFIEDNELKDKVSINMQERGLTIHLTEGALFDSGYADLRPDSKILLDKLAGELKKVDKNIRVEGHTDNVPIHNYKFPSNWELSATRAVTVVRYFIEKHGFSPSTMSAVGYGEYRPVVPNNSDKNRAQNRRVDIVILKSHKENI